VKAWRFGAFEWRKYNDQGKADFWPVREAWEIYKPVGLISSASTLEYPGENKVSIAYTNELENFIADEIRFRVTELENEIRVSSGRNRQRKINSLGILYARNGMYNDAISTLRPLTEGNNAYLPAVLNLANIHYLTGSLDLAVRNYRRAAESMRNPAAAYLGLAMAENKLGNSEAAGKAYNEFAALAPGRAEEYAFLAESRNDVPRSSSAFGDSRVLWEDEE
jgi:tetratricopeptide (TPR) repeat protein